jgi:hypothetical protein
MGMSFRIGEAPRNDPAPRPIPAPDDMLMTSWLTVVAVSPIYYM